MAGGWEHVAHSERLRELDLFRFCGEEAKGQTCNCNGLMGSYKNGRPKSFLAVPGTIKTAKTTRCDLGFQPGQ